MSDEEDEAAPEEIIVPIEDAIDLHPFAPRDIVEVVRAYLDAALEVGHREVRLIHGKGKGVQRANVQRLLREHPSVQDFQDAPAERGSWGATIVTLRIEAGPR